MYVHSKHILPALSCIRSGSFNPGGTLKLSKMLPRIIAARSTTWDQWIMISKGVAKWVIFVCLFLRATLLTVWPLSVKNYTLAQCLLNYEHMNPLESCPYKVFDLVLGIRWHSIQKYAVWCWYCSMTLILVQGLEFEYKGSRSDFSTWALLTFWIK